MDSESPGLLLFPKVIRENAVVFQDEGADFLVGYEKMSFAEQ